MPPLLNHSAGENAGHGGIAYQRMAGLVPRRFDRQLIHAPLDQLGTLACGSSSLLDRRGDLGWIIDLDGNGDERHMRMVPT